MNNYYERKDMIHSMERDKQNWRFTSYISWRLIGAKKGHRAGASRTRQGEGPIGPRSERSVTYGSGQKRT